jgi:hypothetical protein
VRYDSPGCAGDSSVLQTRPCRLRERLAFRIPTTSPLMPAMHSRRYSSLPLLTATMAMPCSTSVLFYESSHGASRRYSERPLSYEFGIDRVHIAAPRACRAGIVRPRLRQRQSAATPPASGRLLSQRKPPPDRTVEALQLKHTLERRVRVGNGAELVLGSRPEGAVPRGRAASPGGPTPSRRQLRCPAPPPSHHRRCDLGFNARHFTARRADRGLC